eukprot:1259742-Ditylum_brightwellii.AAC.1
MAKYFFLASAAASEEFPIGLQEVETALKNVMLLYNDLEDCCLSSALQWLCHQQLVWRPDQQ